MITALELENFKAFGDRTRVEFAPITLIYGQNSAGKSSILNALNLLKQTRMSRDYGALLLPRTENGLVDLGSFHELLHDHDATKTLTFKLEFELQTEAAVSRRPLKGPVGIEFGFRREHNQRDVALSYLYAFDPRATGPALRYRPKELSAQEAKEFLRYAYVREGRRSGMQDMRAAECVDITEAPDFWSDTFAETRQNAVHVVRALEAMRADVLGREQNQMTLFRDADVRPEHFDEAISFYSGQFELKEFIARRRAADLGTIVLLDGFVPMPTRTIRSTRYPESLASRYMRETPRSAWPLADQSMALVNTGHALEMGLEKLFPLGPYRRPPERLYIFTGTTPADVGYSGNLLPDLIYRKKRLLEDTNRWMDRLDIGYHIEIAAVGNPSNDLFEVRLRDTRRNSSATVALPDVGFGISQLLPFLVQTLASQRQTITIEQPEVHVHPKLQADLGDLLVAGIQPERNHRFIVETHSEHLILRLLRRIRETADGELPEGHPGLQPSQVSVIYLERGTDGTKVHHLRLDDRGEFVDKWPHGFFEERAQELF